MTELPPYLTPGDVGRACGMSTVRARRMMVRAGILERLGGHWHVAESRLRERLPDVYDRVFSYLVLGRSETIRNDQKRSETIGDQPRER